MDTSTRKRFASKIAYCKNYKPTDTGESPLANISKWVNTKCPKCGGNAKEKQIRCPTGRGVLGIICDMLIQK